jgi:hypothetical protein
MQRQTMAEGITQPAVKGAARTKPGCKMSLSEIRITCDIVTLPRFDDTRLDSDVIGSWACLDSDAKPPRRIPPAATACAMAAQSKPLNQTSKLALSSW